MKNPAGIDWLAYESRAAGLGYDVVCGVDEAGRGPLAGPVFAAAVILPVGTHVEGINDSKKLSPKKREQLFDIICEKARAFCVASACVEEIERFNILGATFLAMRRAVEGLRVRPVLVLVDGCCDPGLSVPTQCIVKGDGLSASIAAASILAKVSRDRYMLELDRQYPRYGFARHKGYPTPEHYRAILRYGISPVHRPSFLKNLEEKRAGFESE